MEGFVTWVGRCMAWTLIILVFVLSVTAFVAGTLGLIHLMTGRPA